MSQRVSYYEIAPEGMKIMMDMEKYTKQSSINRTTRELIKIRVSQMNGCAYCIDMHTSDARKMGKLNSEFTVYMLGMNVIFTHLKRKRLSNYLNTSRSFHLKGFLMSYIIGCGNIMMKNNMLTLFSSLIK